MQVFVLLALSVGILVGSGMSQPAAAADFVVEAGVVSNDNSGATIEAGEAARVTIKALLDAIKSEDADAFFKLHVHSEEAKKHVKETFKSLKDMKVTVQSAKQSGNNEINAVVLFTIGKERETGNVVLVKNTDSPTGWVLAQLQKQKDSKISDDRIGDLLQAGEAARTTFKALVDAIKEEDVNLLLKLIDHTEDDKEHIIEIIDSWRNVKITVQSTKISGENIKVVVLIIIGNEKRTGEIVLAKNIDSPTGWIIVHFPDTISPVKIRKMMTGNKMINHTTYDH